MKNGELIRLLQARDPEGDTQLFVPDQDGGVYYDIAKVNGFINAPNTVLEAEEDMISAGQSTPDTVITAGEWITGAV